MPFVINSYESNSIEINEKFMRDFGDTKSVSLSKDYVLSLLKSIEPFKSLFDQCPEKVNFDSVEKIRSFKQELIPEFFQCPKFLTINLSFYHHGQIHLSNLCTFIESSSRVISCRAVYMNGFRVFGANHEIHYIHFLMAFIQCV